MLQKLFRVPKDAGKGGRPKSQDRHRNTARAALFFENDLQRKMSKFYTKRDNVIVTDQYHDCVITQS